MSSAMLELLFETGSFSHFAEMRGRGTYARLTIFYRG